MTVPPGRTRIWEIDFLRGLSIILMVGYHLLFDLGEMVGLGSFPARRSLIPGRLPVTFVNIAGRHSLLIYIVHQPIILAILYLFRLIR